MSYVEIKQEELIECISDGDPEITLFIGAGATVHKKYGLPLANDLGLEILRESGIGGIKEFIDKYKNDDEFKKYFANIGIKDISKLGNKIHSALEPWITLDVIWYFIVTKRGRKPIPHRLYKTLREKLNPRHIPPQYYTIAKLLLRSPIINAVFTSNFDEKLEEAIDRIKDQIKNVLQEEHRAVEIIHTDGQFRYWSDHISSDRAYLCKLHGTLSNPHTIISDFESLAKLSTDKSKMLKKYLTYTSDRPRYFIVIGYSARDEDIRSVLQEGIEESQDPPAIYWCTIELGDSSRNLLNKLSEHADVFYCEVDSFSLLKNIEKVILPEG